MKNYIGIMTIVFLIITSGCVQKRHTKTVTFSVDMNGIENVKDVGIRGDFNNWSETIPLTDKNSDGIYEATFSKETAKSTVEFKFVNQNKEFELEGQNNRKLTFEYKPETLVYKTKFNNPKDIEIIKK